VDEAAVAFGGALGWGKVDGAEQAAGFGDLAAELDAGCGLAVEGLRLGGGAALLAEGEDFDLKLGGFGFDVEGVAGADLAGGLGADGVGGDAAHLAGFGGEFAGFEEAGGPEVLVDAGAGHGGIVVQDVGRGSDTVGR
jgi:hypothetical protein